MPRNDQLRIHVLNVGHGDAVIIELPDYGDGATQTLARFGVVDFGARRGADRGVARDYLDRLAQLRIDGQEITDYQVEFACVTHPHNDHYGGLQRFMSRHVSKVRRFWDCGFRTTALTDNTILAAHVIPPQDIMFPRVAAGAVYTFGRVRVTVLAPSIDLRNRFDTYGVGMNDASIVLKVEMNNSRVILAADAEFASWGKITEEYPRTARINFHKDAQGLAERSESSEQLTCDLLKLSHHGSMHGTALEYLRRIEPNRVAICAGDDQWYVDHAPNWQNYFPHQLINNTLDVLGVDPGARHVTGRDGHLIYCYGGGVRPNPVNPHAVDSDPCDPGPAFDTELAAAL